MSMGLYFRKRIMKLLFGGRLTFGSGGFGLSFGKKNVRLHINSGGSYVNTRIPKTNIYVGKKIGTPAPIKEETKSSNQRKNTGCGCGTIIGCYFTLLLLGAIVLMAKDIILGIWNGNGINGDDIGGLVLGIIIFLFILVKMVGGSK